MSLIVAIKEQSRIYIGSDTMVCNDGGSTWHDKSKIWKSSSNKKILIGGVGYLSVIEKVRHGYPFDADTPTLETVNAWMQNIISTVKDDDDYSFIICGNGKIFIASCGGLIIEAKDYEAIGSGRNVAMGALYSIDKFIPDPEEKIRVAISAAMRYNIFVGGSIDLKMI